MKHRLIFRIGSIALLLAMMGSLAACAQNPPEPSTGSDFIQASSTDSSGTESSEPEQNREEEMNGEHGKQTDTDEAETSSLSTDVATETGTETTSSKTSNAASTSSNTSTSTKNSTSSKTLVSSPSSIKTDTVNSDTEPEDTPAPPATYTDISPISPENYYGRTWLAQQSNGKKLIKTYDELAEGIRNMRESISLTAGITVEELFTVWNCFQSDYSHFFWLNGEYRYYYTGNKATSISPTYIMTKSEAEAAQRAFESSVKKILSGIHSGMTQYEIEKTIHDQLIVSCTYSNTANAHNAYGALVEGKAVCEGISRAFQYLCLSVGIDALLVYGQSKNPSSGASENHSWNIVKIDGKYYHVDVTWDNTGEPAENRIHYAWFNLPTERIDDDHTLVLQGYSYPLCTETAANYFRKVNGEISELTVRDVMERTVKQGDEFFFQAYVLNQTDPHGWVSENAGALAKEYGLNGYSYRSITMGKEVCIVMGPYKG